MAEVMKAIPFTQFSMEMRSGKIIDIDDGFTELPGYTEDDFEAGIVFKQFVPLKVLAFYKIENKLLAGHRVIKVSAAVIE